MLTAPETSQDAAFFPAEALGRLLDVLLPASAGYSWEVERDWAQVIQVGMVDP